MSEHHSSFNNEMVQSRIPLWTIKYMDEYIVYIDDWITLDKSYK